MVTIKVRKRYGAGGATTVEWRVTAESIERAVELAGPGAEIVFPLDPEAFFAPSSANDAAEGVAEVRPEAAALAGAAA